jgi:multiple sugar transport system ATP-binding protein
MRLVRSNNPPVPQLTLEKLAKSFPAPNGLNRVALAGITLTIAPGQLLTIVGPSGSGKTTTLRLIAGLESPDSGIIKLGDQVVNSVPPVDRSIAMVFQRDALLPHLTAAQNIALGLILRRADRASIARQVGTIAEKMGIVGCLARRPAELSGGERQRVALARALIRRPDILLLDEPFAHLDAPLRRELRRELLRLHQERTLTTLLVTHDQAEALAFGSQVAVMNAGQIDQIGPPETLRNQPATQFVREFLDPSVV